MYLEHDATDVVYALGDGFAGAGNGDCTLGRVGQHLGGDLDGGAGDLANLLDLGTTLADEGATLGGGHDEPQGNGGPGHAGSAATSALDVVELGAPLLELLAYQREGLEDGVRRSGHGHYPLGARAVGDVYLGTGLQNKRRPTGR